MNTNTTQKQLSDIASRIKEMREIMGWTCEDMAEKAEVSVSDYRLYEQAAADIPFSFLHKCSLAFGVEMTEPDCIKYTKGASFTCSDVEKAKAQAIGTYNTAVELFAQLCDEFNLNPMTDSISHSEGYAKGIASNHGDPVHLWRQLGLNYTMDTFRNDVKKRLNVEITTFTVKVSITNLNIRKGPGKQKYGVVGVCPTGVYTIVDTKLADGHTWGKLKSGIGWIALEYTTRL